MSCELTIVSSYRDSLECPLVPLDLEDRLSAVSRLQLDDGEAPGA